MSVVVGVDGCKGGWAVCAVDGERVEFGIHPRVASWWLAYPSAAQILVDMPIGLPEPDTYPREADMAAKQFLGTPRRASVFTVPIRACVERGSQGAAYADLCAHSRELTGKAFAKQTYWLLPRIAEVDTFLRGNGLARAKVRESHPEVVFAALNGGIALASKKREPTGQAERTGLLERHLRDIRRHLEQIPRELRRFAAADDWLDAVALAVAGCYPLRELPEKPLRDAQGLPMEIVYPVVS